MRTEEQKKANVEETRSGSSSLSKRDPGNIELSQHKPVDTGAINDKICDGVKPLPGQAAERCIEPSAMDDPHSRPNARSPIVTRPVDLDNSYSFPRSAGPPPKKDDIQIRAKYVQDEQLVMWTITCTDRQQEDCQPVCTESLTRGCTESRTPNFPEIDRHEGKYTHK